MRVAVSATGKIAVAGSLPRRYSSRHHWIKALTLFFTPGWNRICPCATVRSDHPLKSYPTSSKVLSMQDRKSLLNMSFATLAAFVTPLWGSASGIPQRTNASRTVYITTAAILPIYRLTWLVDRHSPHHGSFCIFSWSKPACCANISSKA